MTTPIPDESPVETPAAPVMYSAEQLQELVRAALAEERQANQAQITTLQATVDSLAKSISGTTPVFTTEHGGGVGTNIHPTWSQFEQELMNGLREAPSLIKLGEALAAVV